MAVFGQHRFRMELHTEQRHCFVGKRHGHAVIRSCGNAKRSVLRQPGDQRVIAPCHERARDTGEKRAAIVMNGRCLAMYRPWRPRDRAAERRGNRLVAETDAEQRDAAIRRGANEGNGNARAFRTAGAGREQDRVGLQGNRFRDRNFIRADGAAFISKFADIAGKIVNEAVEIIDDEDHTRSPAATVSRPASALRMFSALASVSSYSAAGSESATIPPPA